MLKEEVYIKLGYFEFVYHGKSLEFWILENNTPFKLNTNLADLESSLDSDLSSIFGSKHSKNSFTHMPIIEELAEASNHLIQERGGTNILDHFVIEHQNEGTKTYTFMDLPTGSQKEIYTINETYVTLEDYGIMDKVTFLNMSEEFYKIVPENSDNLVLLFKQIPYKSDVANVYNSFQISKLEFQQKLKDEEFNKIIHKLNEHSDHKFLDT
ncbi:hypothetical protein U3516DRAFT_738206 [Neocallimastix sp. 'constans']